PPGHEPGGTEANKPETPRRARSSRSNHCAGSAGAFRLTCGDYARVLFCFAREAAGAPAPGIPCALLLNEGHRMARTRTQIAPRDPCRLSGRLPRTIDPRASVASAGDHGRKRVEHGPGCNRDSGGDDDVG